VIRIDPRQINLRTSLTVIWLESEGIPDSGEMPWKESDAMKERVKFVLEWERRWHEGEGKLNFAALYREFGIALPAAIRSDNGPPFASIGAGGLTVLSVWWLRLGIRLERIEPVKPQQNGRQGGFHRTLKAETTEPAQANLRAHAARSLVAARAVSSPPAQSRRRPRSLVAARAVSSPPAQSRWDSGRGAAVRGRVVGLRVDEFDAVPAWLAALVSIDDGGGAEGSQGDGGEVNRRPAREG
jgi:hypothetical protein